MAEPEDNINPSHYQKGEIEVIDFIIDQDMDYFTASAVKYLCRWRDKHKGGGQVLSFWSIYFYTDLGSLASARSLIYYHGTRPSTVALASH